MESDKSTANAKRRQATRAVHRAPEQRRDHPVAGVLRDGLDHRPGHYGDRDLMGLQIGGDGYAFRQFVGRHMQVRDVCLGC